MSLLDWFRGPRPRGDSHGGDRPPRASLLNTLLGRDEERAGSLGEYDSDSYPTDLADLLRLRSEVSEDVLRVDVADREARIEAIPHLQQLLRKYPHPLVYELLVQSYLDAGRFDEAKGVAFAARERRVECARSPHPEIRSETDRLRAWDPEEIDQLRSEADSPKSK